jgi:hypothetical protein
LGGEFLLLYRPLPGHAVAAVLSRQLIPAFFAPRAG